MAAVHFTTIPFEPNTANYTYKSYISFFLGGGGAKFVPIIATLPILTFSARFYEKCYGFHALRTVGKCTRRHLFRYVLCSQRTPHPPPPVLALPLWLSAVPKLQLIMASKQRWRWKMYSWYSDVFERSSAESRFFCSQKRWWKRREKSSAWYIQRDVGGIYFNYDLWESESLTTQD